MWLTDRAFLQMHVAFSEYLVVHEFRRSLYMVSWLCRTFVCLFPFGTFFLLVLLRLFLFVVVCFLSMLHSLLCFSWRFGLILVFVFAVLLFSTLQLHLLVFLLWFGAEKGQGPLLSSMSF